MEISETKLISFFGKKKKNSPVRFEHFHYGFNLRPHDIMNRLAFEGKKKKKKKKKEKEKWFFAPIKIPIGSMFTRVPRNPLKTVSQS